MALVHRFIRVLIFLSGLAIGVVGTLFAIGNQNSIPITIWSYTFHVQVYALALVPLAAGLALGWLYTMPARTAEFADHWRSWRELRAMEKENKQLRKSLDRVLELPDERAPALPARDVAKLPAARDERLEAEPVVVHEVKPAAAPTNGHRREAAVKKTVVKAVAAPKPAAKVRPDEAKPAKEAPRRRRAVTASARSGPATHPA